MGQIHVSSVWAIALLAGLVALKECISQLILACRLQKLRCQNPPLYPQKVPYIGSDLSSVLDQARQDGVLASKLQQLFQTYGKTFQATIWGQKVLYTMEDANIQAVHTTEFRNFGAEPIRKTVNQGWMGDGIFVSDGAMWKHSRSLLKPMFSKGQYADLPSLDVHVNRLLALVPGDGVTVDLQPLFQRLVRPISLLGPKSRDSFPARLYLQALELTRKSSFSTCQPSFSSENLLILCS